MKSSCTVIPNSKNVPVINGRFNLDSRTSFFRTFKIFIRMKWSLPSCLVISFAAGDIMNDPRVGVRMPHIQNPCCSTNTLLNFTLQSELSSPKGGYVFTTVSVAFVSSSKDFHDHWHSSNVVFALHFRSKGLPIVISLSCGTSRNPSPFSENQDVQNKKLQIFPTQMLFSHTQISQTQIVTPDISQESIPLAPLLHKFNINFLAFPHCGIQIIMRALTHSSAINNWFYHIHGRVLSNNFPQIYHELW